MQRLTHRSWEGSSTRLRPNGIVPNSCVKCSISRNGIPSSANDEQRNLRLAIQGFFAGNQQSKTFRLRKRMAPRAGLEPATFRLTAERSTIELPGSSARQNTEFLPNSASLAEAPGAVNATGRATEAREQPRVREAKHPGRRQVRATEGAEGPRLCAPNRDSRNAP
jgi:hypothetical protein